MQSLFLKIFLWFWATVFLTGIALILAFVLQHGGVPARWHAMLADTARSSGTVAVEEVEQGGIPAAAAYLEQLEREARLRACLFDDSGHRMAGEQCETFSDLVARVAASRTSEFALRYGLARVALMLRGRSGRQYIFATELPAGPRAAAGTNPVGIVLEWGTAFLVSGLICYLLTRYLTGPILQLRRASHQLAKGELNTRAAPGMERRRDELGALVRDFNSMADHIEQLISSQRQLIYDISHEVRSPLARLNVALDLARERKGSDPAFDRMNQDIGRLGDMMGRLLAIARLDTSAAPTPFSLLNLTEILSRVVTDARFESQERRCSVQLDAAGRCFVHGNAELLHSAIENLIRNAVRYTAPGTPVEVGLECTTGAGKTRSARLTIRDHGPGVPESELRNIFRPFYRVADARDRQSGGSGLGLAIADRVVRLHQGTIYAENAAGNGLEIKVSLPLADSAAES
jgi:two-component system, OmpR family, sensor histidine kinase CpxA